MENDLMKLIVVEGLVEAQVIKSKLDNFGIPSMLKFEPVGRLMGITMDGLGKVQVLVNRDDIERARDLLSGEAEDK